MIRKMKIGWLGVIALMGLQGSVLGQGSANKRANLLPIENPSGYVNVFLGTSGDHGQLSPAASYPFSMLSIVPQTDPWIHTGYEHYAKKFLGFAHSVFEGVGCEGSGANLLVRPFTGEDPKNCDLIKSAEAGAPGFYEVLFKNGIKAAFTVSGNEGLHEYQFAATSGSQRGLFFDLSHTRANRFYDEQHETSATSISGWIQAGTTCSVGRYKIYYYISLSEPVKWEKTHDHQLIARFASQTKKIELRIGWSSTSEAYAKAAVDHQSFEQLRQAATQAWNDALGRIAIGQTSFSDTSINTTMKDRRSLFYSLLYRVIQSPYLISEKDGTYRNTKGALVKSDSPVYNGWSVWDNYRTQLPLLALAYSDRYQSIVNSLSGLYANGKQDYATQTEPSNTVRTEHTGIVLLDAYNKGYKVDFKNIIDSIKKEVDHLDFSHPDKALESSYDTWAVSEIYKTLGNKTLQQQYKNKALNYRTVWEKEFADLSKKDIDKMGARGMYQGTVWQYRWLVPYDMAGLTQLIGSKTMVEEQLDQFFNGNYYSQANEPDIAAPSLYNVTAHPSKAQYLMHQYAVDTVTQFYFNGNSRGIDPVIGPVYRNQPRAFLPTMDDDGGAMSGWFVFSAIGLFPACVGAPVYYLHVPLFEDLTINMSRVKGEGKKLHIKVHNFSPDNCYIRKVVFNGQELRQSYLTDAALRAGGELEIFADNQPHDPKGWDTWVSQIH